MWPVVFHVYEGCLNLSAHGATEIAAVWQEFCGDLSVACDSLLPGSRFIFLGCMGMTFALRLRCVGEESVEQARKHALSPLVVFWCYVRHVKHD